MEYDFIEDHPFDNPEADKAWLACKDHPICLDSQSEVERLQEALSSYPREELSDRQNEFLDWFEVVTA